MITVMCQKVIISFCVSRVMTHNCVADVTQLKCVQLKLFNCSDLNKLLPPPLFRKAPATSCTPSSSSSYLLLLLLVLAKTQPNNRHSLISAVAY